MDYESVLRIQIDGQAFHFENFGDLTTFDSPVVEHGVAISINRLEVKLAQKDSKGGLTDLVACRRAYFRDIFKAYMHIFDVHGEVVEDLDL